MLSNLKDLIGKITPNTSWSSLSSLDSNMDTENTTNTEAEHNQYKIQRSTSCLCDYEHVCKKPAVLISRSISFPVTSEEHGSLEMFVLE